MNAPFSALEALAVRPSSAADHARIEAFVRERPEGQLFHLPQWAQAVERGCEQRSCMLLAEGSDGSLKGVLPLTHMRSRLTGNALVSSGFAVGGGILASSPAASEALGQAAWRLTESLGLTTVELRGGDIPDGWHRREGVYAGFERELPADEAAILASIPKKQRAEVRKGQGMGLRLSIGREEQLGGHYAAYSESVRNHGTPIFPKRLFAAMLEAFGEDADIVTLWHDGKPVSSVFSFYFRDTVMPYWGGGTREARQLRANELLYFELMRHAAARGCTRFDYGRSKVGTGAYAFKKNWGFEPKPLVYGVKTADGAAPRVMNPMDPKYRLQVAAWKRLPLWLANKLGPPIARGLG